MPKVFKAAQPGRSDRKIVWEKFGEYLEEEESKKTNPVLLGSVSFSNNKQKTAQSTKRHPWGSYKLKMRKTKKGFSISETTTFK